MSTPRLGIALSGGATRAFAHLGVLRAFRDRGFRPDALAGSSAGALMGALWAAGWSREEIREAAQGFAPFQPWRYSFARPGLFDFRYFRHYWSRYLPARFEDLDRPLTVIATDIETGEPKYFSRGRLEPAIAASCSLTPLFEPVKIGERWYFDGGFSMNLPTPPLRSWCSVVVASEVNPHEEANPEVVHSTWRLFMRSMEVVFRTSSPRLRALGDLLIEPEGLDQIHPLDTSRYDEIEELGYQGAIQAIDGAQNLLDRLPRSTEDPTPPARDVAIPEASSRPVLQEPAYPGLPGVAQLTDHPERALGLLALGGAALGLAWWLSRRQS